MIRCDSFRGMLQYVQLDEFSFNWFEAVNRSISSSGPNIAIGFCIRLEQCSNSLPDGWWYHCLPQLVWPHKFHVPEFLPAVCQFPQVVIIALRICDRHGPRWLTWWAGIRYALSDNSHIPASSPPLEITTIVASFCSAWRQATRVSSISKYDVAGLTVRVHQFGRSYPLWHLTGTAPLSSHSTERKSPPAAEPPIPRRSTPLQPVSRSSSQEQLSVYGFSSACVCRWRRNDWNRSYPACQGVCQANHAFFHVTHRPSLILADKSIHHQFLPTKVSYGVCSSGNRTAVIFQSLGSKNSATDASSLIESA